MHSQIPIQNKNTEILTVVNYKCMIYKTLLQLKWDLNFNFIQHKLPKLPNDKFQLMNGKRERLKM